MHKSTKRSLLITLAFVAMVAGGLVFPNLSPVSAPVVVAMAEPNSVHVDPNDIPFYVPCGTESPHHYVDDPNKESVRSFGPASSVILSEMWDDFYVRMCGTASEDHLNEGGVEGGDDALFRGVDAAVHPELDPNRDLSLVEWQNQATDLMQRIDAKSITLVRKTSAPGTHSLYMKKSSSGTIVIEAIEVKPRTSWYLKFTVVTDRGPVEVELREECGFQPDLRADQLPVALR